MKQRNIDGARNSSAAECRRFIFSLKVHASIKLQTCVYLLKPKIPSPASPSLAASRVAFSAGFAQFIYHIAVSLPPSHAAPRCCRRVVAEVILAGKNICYQRRATTHCRFGAWGMPKKRDACPCNVLFITGATIFTLLQADLEYPQVPASTTRSKRRSLPLIPTCGGNKAMRALNFLGEEKRTCMGRVNDTVQRYNSS